MKARVALQSVNILPLFVVLAVILFLNVFCFVQLTQMWNERRVIYVFFATTLNPTLMLLLFFSCYRSRIIVCKLKYSEYLQYM
jgi:hypothetical protein